MNILTPVNFQDYELLDSGECQRLERFGKYILARPDPQAIWKPKLSQHEWDKAQAVFKKTSAEKGFWEKKGIPDKWVISWKDIKFQVRLSPFKHTGVFPEQSVHWAFISEKISQSNDKPNVLNLFGYTGIVSLVAAKLGARVTHVDASYPTIGWARENQKLSGLDGKPIRWILDDCLKFCQREEKRGVKYDGIIMDPPIYGHGPKGEKWDFNESFPRLMEICAKLLPDNPLSAKQRACSFIIVNAYAISASSIMLKNVLKDYLKDGQIESGELALKESSGRLLSTGIFARWSAN
ncbi:class I SAM-dependent methyltransferase [Candidatus Daviesbacteria bacterium]|nr:class I SAM-dependent methyltransferase [Candidatus Daviesbacteria bacterium]